MQDLWAISVALRHEAKGLLGRLKVDSVVRHDRAVVHLGKWQDRAVALLETGMGPENASKSVKFFLQEFRPRVFISTGYCGGLQDFVSTGDGVLSSAVFFHQAAHPNRKDGVLLEPQVVQRAQALLQSKGVKVHLGDALTVVKPVLGSVEKSRLGALTGACAVDMESYFVLKTAQIQEKITSLALRFVVDAQEDNLADTSAFMDQDAGFRPMGLLRETLRRPKLLWQLPGLDRRARQARESLDRAVMVLLEDSTWCF